MGLLCCCVLHCLLGCPIERVVPVLLVSWSMAPTACLATATCASSLAPPPRTPTHDPDHTLPSPLPLHS